MIHTVKALALIHIVKGFSVVSEAEVDVFLEFPFFFYDPTDVGNLMSGSSTSFGTQLANLEVLCFCTAKF